MAEIFLVYLKKNHEGNLWILPRSLMIEYRIVMRNKSSELLYYIELGLDSISLKCLENMKTVYQDENIVVLDENSVE